ncbi:amidohydrolase [Peribacillus simplex]|uniref:amidohydrolase n=1 Tax=Peribacillus TaxID=2675229 RepID=UPI00177D2ACA|nr:amidohydrolase [Brevibacillus sp. JNUCC-41]QOS92076.1 amidohydrolase [Brevibacillus sp. JNUCC-41]
MKRNFLSKRNLFIFSLVFVLALVGFSSGTLPDHLDSLAPDTVYFNGKVITMDKGATIAEAVAVKDGKIIAVGSNKEIGKLKGRHTKVVNLMNKVLLPGFYDAHSHFPSSGMDGTVQVNLNSPPVGPIKNIDDLIIALKDRTMETHEGEWILGRGYDQTLLAEGRHPTRENLDKVSTEHPIYIGHTSGHLAVANSVALKMAGITKDTPDPPGGVIVRDPKTGEPTGVLEESAIGLVSKHIPVVTEEENLAAFKKAVQDYISKGVTTSIIAGANKQGLIDLQRYQKQGLLPLRITAMGAGFGGAITSGELGGIVTGFGSDMLKLGPVKLSHDGSIQGYTGYLSKPYHVPPGDDPNYRGYPATSREDLTKRVVDLHKAGYQIAIHGNGDAAIDDILYAFRTAQEEYPRKDARHRIEHAQMARLDQLDEMKKLGVTPSYFVSHTFFWGDQHRDIFMGPERAAMMSPLKSSIDRGIKFSIHLDSHITPMDPLQAVWSAVNRISRSGKVIGPEQRITPLEALRAVTSDAAWQNFEENEKGSIEKGKFADFVVLEENPLTVDPIKIKEIKVLKTIVNDKVIYEN